MTKNKNSNSNSLVRYLKNNILFDVVMIYFVIYFALIYYDLSSYITELLASYIIFLVIYSLWRSYSIIQKDGWHSLVTKLSGSIITISVLLLILGFSTYILRYYYNYLSNLTSIHYLNLSLIGISVIVILSISVLGVLFINVYSRVFIETRLEGRIFGWSSYWDEKIIEKLEEEDLVENVDYTEEGIVVKVKEDINLDDYTFKYGDYNIEVNV